MPNSFSDLKTTALEKRRATLIEQYEAANAQLRGALSAADRVIIQEQIANLEQEIQQVDNELGQLGDQSIGANHLRDAPSEANKRAAKLQEENTETAKTNGEGTPASNAPGAEQQKEGWSRNDKIALATLIVTILGILIAITIPEVRQFLGLETPTPSPTATSAPTFTPIALIVDPTETPAPTSTPTPVPTEPPTATPEPTATPMPTATPGAILREQDRATMVYVPAGEFLMGSTADDIAKFTGLCRQECQQADFEDELEQHPVFVEAFWIDETEVTNAQYKQCVEIGQCATSEFAENNNSNSDSQPVVGVSWNDALTYCRWAGARLPTEAEWEKAARGTAGSLYPWGDVFKSEVVNHGYQHDFTLLVKTLDNASPYGAYDMVGNVWEWTSSLYQAYDYDSNDGRENLEVSGPRVIRGGAWLNEAGFVHAASRSGEAVDHRYGRIGFRCARSIQ